MNSTNHQSVDTASKNDDEDLSYRKNGATLENHTVYRIAATKNEENELNSTSILQSSENDYGNHLVDHYNINYIKQHFQDDIKVCEKVNDIEFNCKIPDNINDNNHSSQLNVKEVDNKLIDPHNDIIFNENKFCLKSLENSINKNDDNILKEQEGDLKNSLNTMTQKMKYNDDQNDFRNNSGYGSPKRNDNEKFISSEDLLADFAGPRNEIFQDASLPENLNVKKNSQSLELLIPEKTQMIQVEEIFYKFGFDIWFKPNCLHPRVESLIYWRDVKKSSLVFGIGMVVLLAISCYSVISVIAYSALISLSGTIAYRIYKNLLAAVQKTSDGHPFKEYLDWDINLSQEKVQNICTIFVAHLNAFITEIRRLFLVEDLVDSLKFGVILWVLTYVGSWFNGMTLVILAYISIFSLPKIYEQNKQIIDQNLDIARFKLLEITDK
ncbi:clustered-asparagine-rich protein-like isoform X2 [Condylostylus longicornis]|nr:clustered-asparagine-rich protein-like isoform X2 [Condylostylus longicornis]